MLSKNVVMGLQKPCSCLDCQYKIFSDVNLSVLYAVDLDFFKFLVKCNFFGRPVVHSMVAMLKALVYMELSGIPIVRQFVKMLENDIYIK
jgi:hypothetical protein